jgi:hypothetical protein
MNGLFSWRLNYGHLIGCSVWPREKVKIPILLRAQWKHVWFSAFASWNEKSQLSPHVNILH